MNSITKDRLQLCSAQECTREARAPRGLCWSHYKRDIRYGSPTAGSPRFDDDGMRWVQWVVAQETDECLPFPWVGATIYGHVTYYGERVTAPHAAASLAHGPANGRIATHSCKTKPCCNKRHVGWGTRDSNMKDRIRDGTNGAGEASVVAKLTNEDVWAIRACRGTEPQTATAARFGISQTHVSEIQLRKTWKYI